MHAVVSNVCKEIPYKKCHAIKPLTGNLVYSPTRLHVEVRNFVSVRKPLFLRIAYKGDMMPFTMLPKDTIRFAFHRQPCSQLGFDRSPSYNKRDSEVCEQQVIIFRLKQKILQFGLAPYVILRQPKLGTLCPKYVPGLLGKVSCRNKDNPEQIFSLSFGYLVQIFSAFLGSDHLLTLALNKPKPIVLHRSEFLQ